MLLIFRLLLCLVVSISLAADPTHPDHDHQESQSKTLQFELGEVELPIHTQWRSIDTPQGKLHMGMRSENPLVMFMISVSNSGSSLSDNDRQGAMKVFAEGYCTSLANAWNTKTESVENTPTEDGCWFSCRLSDGNSLYGRLYQGRVNTLVLTGLGTSKEEFTQWCESFTPDHRRFTKPLSQSESGSRAAANFCWMIGGLNLIIALLAGLIGIAAHRPFWQTTLVTQSILLGLELAAGIPAILAMVRPLGLAGTIILASLVGLAVTCGVPTLATYWLTKRLARSRIN